MTIRFPRPRFRIRTLLLAVAVVALAFGVVSELFVRRPALVLHRTLLEYHLEMVDEWESMAELPGRSPSSELRTEMLALAAWHRSRAGVIREMDPMSITLSMARRERAECRTRDNSMTERLGDDLTKGTSGNDPMARDVLEQVLPIPGLSGGQR